MNNTTLKTQIDSNITNKTDEASISPSEVGGDMKAIIDLVKPYKELRFLLTISSLVPTPTYEVNELTSDNNDITMTIPSNGVLDISITGNVLTNEKVRISPTTIQNGGTPYFLVPDFGYLPVMLRINIKKFDNTQTGTPLLANERIIIRVYD